MQLNDITPSIQPGPAFDNAIARLKQTGVELPTFAQLADPGKIPERIRKALEKVAPDDPNAANLFRVHWNNDEYRTGQGATPRYLVLPEELTQVKAKIVVALGYTFPMIGAHKVLPAYACLVTRLVTGRFDPLNHRAVWPSTGNYCRGGVALSRIMGCRGIAVLPAGMSQERFDWLANWVADPSDIVRTPGTESNVKEIYDKCAEMAQDPSNVILNQFSEFGNYLSHISCTGPALERIFNDVKKTSPGAKLAAFVAASGSAGTLAAGDYLKAAQGAKIVAVEASECPTLLYNGHGEHNIQGIGDKHVPLIHNVMNTDIVVGISDRATDELDLLFNSSVGKDYLTKRRHVDQGVVADLKLIGFSGICNVLAAIKTARRLELGSDDVLVTIATDSGAMYGSEREKLSSAHYPDGFDAVSAGEVFGRHLLGLADNDLIEMTHLDRRRVFNLGYYTWVEQQGLSTADFDRRKDQSFWQGIAGERAAWDKLIEEFNARTGVKLGA